jgi:HD-GYP domain-containing protein (c-di-GMP phosphodiesterase class II)
MSGSKGVLIFNKNEQERKFLRFLLKTEDHGVFDTADSLGALKILQDENIGLMLVGSDLKGMSRPDFKRLIEKLKPGVSSVFISPFPEKAEELTINIEEFLKVVTDYLKGMGVVDRELSQMKKFSYSIADRLLQIFSVSDKYFFNNNHLVAELSKKIAVKMGLEESLVEAIQMGALLRDLGKLMIHQQILEENKRLTQSELTPMKAHPSYTVQILREVEFPWNLDSIIGEHHEYYDGSGYPLGLKGREISIGARIICIADSYYAMTTDRPYRKAMTKDQALVEVRKNAGSQFDPEVVEMFLSMIRQDPSLTIQKKNILIFERKANIAAMLKLGMIAEEIDIVHAANSIDALGSIRQMKPELVIADIETLGPDAFMNFYQTAQHRFAAKACFLIVAPDKGYLKDFLANIDHIFRPLTIDTLTAKVRAMLLESPLPFAQENDRGLSGRIEDFSLSDIIQILGMGLKTAKVEIDGDKGKGILYLAHGKVVHASTGNLLGPEAFYELMGCEEGSFFIRHGHSIDEVNVTLDTMYLLLEAARIIDERASARPRSGEDRRGPSAGSALAPKAPAEH